MIDKNCSIENIRSRFKDSMTVMVGGFGVPGTPFTLIDALLATGASDLTLIKNEANEDHMGLSKLIEAGRCKKIITSHLGLNATVIGFMNRGEIEVDFYPQGILAEKIRAGGAGLFGFLTDIGIDTILSDKKQMVTINGREVIAEPALRADVALIHAAVADHSGNLVYEKSARNFNPLMATAADTVIAEVERVVETGSLDPDQIHTPGAFVDYLVEIKELTQEYGILAHHVI
ncbi:MAG: CoA transferase subunit A [Desulfobacteraceae bacterium]|jgi:acetate CoA/acetoacetate CoA-transferase alpha subunit|nr:CoA transferase subunit A [Desulfobacteraceae bacterium]